MSSSVGIPTIISDGRFLDRYERMYSFHMRNPVQRNVCTKILKDTLEYAGDDHAQNRRFSIREEDGQQVGSMTVCRMSEQVRFHRFPPDGIHILAVDFFETQLSTETVPIFQVIWTDIQFICGSPVLHHKVVVPVLHKYNGDGLLQEVYPTNITMNGNPGVYISNVGMGLNDTHDMLYHPFQTGWIGSLCGRVVRCERGRIRRGEPEYIRFAYRGGR